MQTAIPYDIFDTLPRDCWVDIDTKQLAENVRLLKKQVPGKTLVVVKANGYGHGYANAARAFLDGGADYLGVATLSEGMLLRKLGFAVPLLVICGLLPAEMTLAAAAGIDFLVWRPDHFEALRAMPKHAEKIRVHLEIDTGMGRGGCLPQDAVEAARSLAGIAGIEFTGVATHFASADVPGVDDTAKQIEKFEGVVAALKAAGLKPRIVHAANSPGTLYFPQAHYDMVRLGITAYGLPPDDGMPIPEGVKTALTWRTRITSTKILPKTHGVGYGSEFIMPKDARIGVLPVGYADGYRRSPKNVNSVLVRGEERKTLGRICMDQCMIDLDGFGDITGEEVILIGKQGNRELSVEELARRWKTNTYDCYTGIAARVPRRVV